VKADEQTHMNTRISENSFSSFKISQIGLS